MPTQRKGAQLATAQFRGLPQIEAEDEVGRGGTPGPALSTLPHYCVT